MVEAWLQHPYPLPPSGSRPYAVRSPTRSTRTWPKPARTASAGSSKRACSGRPTCSNATRAPASAGSPRAPTRSSNATCSSCSWTGASGCSPSTTASASRRTSARTRRSSPGRCPEMFRVLHDIESDEPITNVFAISLRELKKRIAVHAQPDQLDRWCNATKEYIFAQVWEAANREVGRGAARPRTTCSCAAAPGPCIPCIALIDIAGGLPADPGGMAPPGHPRAHRARERPRRLGQRPVLVRQGARSTTRPATTS